MIAEKRNLFFSFFRAVLSANSLLIFPSAAFIAPLPAPMQPLSEGADLHCTQLKPVEPKDLAIVVVVIVVFML